MTKYYWKVRVWDKNGKASDWSPTATWETALLQQNDWKAKWIGSPDQQDNDTPKTSPAPYFRKQFNLRKPVKSARAYISGLGYYELYLNGHKIGDHVLSPNQTNYDKRDLRKMLYPYDDKSTTRVFYETYDITSAFNQGNNVAGVVLGNGWYNQRDRTEEGILWYDTPRMILQIEVEYTDGKQETIITDNSWKVATGPLLHDGIFTGEIYDARMEKDGWNKVNYDDSDWNTAINVRAPEGQLMAQLSPPDRIIRTITPRQVKSQDKNVLKYDMGEMISGWARITVQGERGTEIRLRFREDSGIDYGQWDTYILKGDGIESYEPRFTWHAFRYVEVYGLTDKKTLKKLEGRVVNSDLKTAGFFECSNDLFNKILENYRRTHLGNIHGNVSSDCPHRERLGYTGDGQILVESAIFNFDMSQFYTKWSNDMKDAQNSETGFVPHSAPFGGGGGGPAWGSSYVIVPWFMYLYYGDERILEEHYSGMKKWVEYLATRTDKDGIIDREEPGGWCLGDWAAPENLELPPTFVNTCYYAYVSDILASAAQILGKPTDAQHYTDQSHSIKETINKHFLNTSEGFYSTGRQGADVFPLAFDFVPPEFTNSVLSHLINNIVNNKGHLDTGILATPLMLDVLTKYGNPDAAYTIMNQRDFPSYGYSIAQGATTLWEYWDGKLSRSHPMYGSVIRWFYQALAGIYPDPKQTGFKNIIINPNPCLGDLTFAKAEYNSVHGKIKSSWQRTDDQVKLDLIIPANTTATVHILASDPVNVTENGNPAEKSESVHFLRMNGNKAVYQVGSGMYSFVSKKIKDLLVMPYVSTPQITPEDSLYMKPDAAWIKIESATQGCDIRYTLDQSQPTEYSLLYKSPFKVTDKTIVTAKAFKKNYKPSFSKSTPIDFVDPNQNGLKYTVYEGDWEKRPDLNTLTAVKTGKVYQLKVDNLKSREDHFAIIFEGFIDIPHDGEYTFYSIANDGSLLYIDETIIVDNAGYSEKKQSGKVVLNAGKHALKVLYFENTGSETIDVFIEGPGLEKQPVPAFMLFQQK